jgi:ABC-type nitrate/sulfonate/bicarbonate transport system substrate-binding protein
MTMRVRVAIPDIVTNSYFAALAAVELGCFARRGIEAEYELVFPSQVAYAAVGAGKAQFVAAPAHSALPAFPGFRGVKLLCALSQGMYWKLVIRSDLEATPGDAGAVRGRRIGAAPMVELGLKHLLAEEKIDLARDCVQIVPVPGADAPGASFGVTAAAALRQGLLDGFWANGMGAAVALRSGAGRVVLDLRRGLGPQRALHYTMPVLATSDALIAADRPLVEAGIAAVVEAEAMLREDPARAGWIGARAFPPEDAALIEEVVRDDLPFTFPDLPAEAIDGLCGFARAVGLLEERPGYADIVPDFAPALWAGEKGMTA